MLFDDTSLYLLKVLDSFFMIADVFEHQNTNEFTKNELKNMNLKKLKFVS